MASPALKLTFDDGTSQDVKINPRVLVEIERKFGNDWPEIEGMLYGAWHRLGRPGEFEKWLDTVELMDRVEEGEAVPTGPEPSDGS